MTLGEAITRIDELKPNAYTRTDKVRWIALLDGLIKEEIINQGDFIFDERRETEYDDFTPANTKLLAEYPYDDIYIRWLEAQIDYYNNEINRYNNSITMFRDMYAAYFTWYGKTHARRDIPVTYFRGFRPRFRPFRTEFPHGHVPERRHDDDEVPHAHAHHAGPHDR